MLINDRHGDAIANHHEGIQINAMLLAIKLLVALIRFLDNLNKLETQQAKSEINPSFNPVKMTAKLDGQTILVATVKPELLPGTNPTLLTGSNPEDSVQQGLSPFPNLPLLEAVEYIDAEVIERHGNSLLEIASLTEGSIYNEPKLDTFEIIDGDNNLLLNYQEGQVEKNVLRNVEPELEYSQDSVIEAELISKKNSNLPEIDSSELSPQPIKSIEDARLAQLAQIVVRYRDPEMGRVAEGKNYRIENRDGVITIFAQDGRGAIFSASSEGYTSQLSSLDYENFSKLDQFVAKLEQERALNLTNSNELERELLF